MHPRATRLHWKHHIESVSVHEAVSDLGVIEIHDTGDSVTSGDQTWPLLSWKARGDGFQVTGIARSLGRAKEDASAALELLSQRDFEGPSPRQREG